MENIGVFFQDLANALWGMPLLILLFGTHIFLTIYLGFIQKYTFKGIKLSLQKQLDAPGDISHFGALMTSLAATVGTGNIVGVATAVALGGPGAVFWMWLTGVFGISTKYAESYLSIKYRVRNKIGQYSGGSMYVLSRRMKLPFLGYLFAIFTCISAFGIGNMVQANSISVMLYNSLGISKLFTGLSLAVVTGLVLLGGIKNIARTCSSLVPIMGFIYLFGCFAIIVLNLESVDDAFKQILIGAFEGQAAIGGFLGAGIRESIRFGISRGLFSNESGLGSAPIIAAAAQTSAPHDQALVSSTSTFFDTVVMCAVTGLAIVISGKWTSGMNGAELIQATFSSLHWIGPIVLSVSMLSFVLSTLIGWSYYGEKSCEFIFGTKSIYPYRFLWVIVACIGSMVSLELVWNIADVTNALMALPNLIMILFLSKEVRTDTLQYFGEDH